MSSPVSRFEELTAWQKARELSREIYRVTREEPFRRDWGLCNQIQRAAVSVMSNLAEGFERGRVKEFHQYVSIAKGSCGEVRSQLYVAWDAAYLTEPTFTALTRQTEELSRILGGLRASLERKMKDAP